MNKGLAGLIFIVAVIAVVSCSRDDPIPTREGPLENEIFLPGAPAVLAAGDIAICGRNGDEATGKLADSLLRADSSRGTQTIIITLGDNAYPSGDEGVNNYYVRCFAPSWGSDRIMNVIHPSPGNHDYDSGSGGPYFQYFGARAGPSGKGYYSFDLNGWHLISLNSEVYASEGVSEQAKAQDEWLRADLRQHQTACTIAYFHRPYLSSGTHGVAEWLEPLWKILNAGGVDLVINGHDHDYERFLPLTSARVVDTLNGMEEIVAGTGGATLRSFRYRVLAHSAARIQGRFGLLKLTLGDGEYRRAFIDTDGKVWDVGGRKCR